MSVVLSERGYSALLDQDIEWLKKHTSQTSLERNHIIQQLKWLKDNQQTIEAWSERHRSNEVDSESTISEESNPDSSKDASVHSALIPGHKPEALALDALSEARMETAVAMFAVVLHRDENENERLFYDSCGEMAKDVLWALKEAQLYLMLKQSSISFADLLD